MVNSNVEKVPFCPGFDYSLRRCRARWSEKHSPPFKGTSKQLYVEYDRIKIIKCEDMVVPLVLAEDQSGVRYWTHEDNPDIVGSTIIDSKSFFKWNILVEFEDGRRQWIDSINSIYETDPHGETPEKPVPPEGKLRKEHDSCGAESLFSFIKGLFK